MNELYRHIETMIKRIQDTGKARIVSAEFRYYSESTLHYKDGKKFPFTIPSSILQFYKEIDFAEISWHAKEDMLEHYLDKELDIVGGFANIPTFDKLLLCLQNNNRRDLIDPTHSFPAEKNNILDNFVPFDYLDGNGAVCFRFNNAQPEDNLYLVKSGVECFIEPLNTGCREYFLAGCKHYFFSDWQQALYLKNENSKKNMNFYIEELKLKNI